MVSSFLDSHPLFVNVRLHVLSSDLFHELIRTQILCYSAKLLSGNANFEVLQNVPMPSTSTHFSLALQLLTHCVQYFANLPATIDKKHLLRFISKVLSTDPIPSLTDSYATPASNLDLPVVSITSIGMQAVSDENRCKICNEVSSSWLLWCHPDLTPLRARYSYI